MKKLNKIRSGGQSGVDRAAMDVAKEYGITLCGWCQKGGWAEDYPEASGLLKDYPELTETPLKDTSQRTVWNMRDAKAILTIIPVGSKESKGTQVGLDAGEEYGKPMLIVSGETEDILVVRKWIDQLPENTEICIGGPRASECSEAYEVARRLLVGVVEGRNIGSR